MELIEFTQARLDELLAAATTLEQLDEIEALWNAAAEANRVAALGDLRKNSIKFLDLVERMEKHISKLAGAGLFDESDAVAGLRAEIGDLHAALHDPNGLKKTYATGDGILEVTKDEEVVPASEGMTALEVPPAPAAPIETPEPVNSSDFVTIADEYVEFFKGMGFRPSHEARIKKMADTAIAHKDRYRTVGDPLGIPWWFVAGLHQMESTYNFTRHLHNGDPLSGRTVHVPANRPATGTPPFSWEESCSDALELQKLDGLADWSLARALWRWERYNGFGYRKKLVPSPYLWSFSSLYLRGKYVADGKWDGAATSQQCGTAVLLKALLDRGEVQLLNDQITESEPAEAPDGTPEEVEPLTVADAPEAPPSHPFQTFFKEKLGDVAHFTWKEFLFKGSKHAQNGLNADPPERLWPNVIPLARALEEIRVRIGAPVRLTSIYRSPAYNASLSGSAKRSQHMAFKAADFQVLGGAHGTSGDWAAVAKAVRSDGVFEGGVGIYNTFVHVDVRGSRADWDSRG